MARIDYEFDQVKTGRNKAGLYVRLSLLCLLFAGLTVGLIWFFRPAREEAPAPEIPQHLAPGEADPNAAASLAAGSPSEAIPASWPTDPATETGATLPLPDEDDDDVDQDPSEDASEDNREGESTPEPTVAEPLPLPVKGMPWAGDPAIDLPQVPKTDLPVAASSSLKSAFRAAELALEERRFPAAAQAALGVLNDPQLIAYSSEWREAAALLTEAHLTPLRERQASPLAIRHNIVPGDTLSKIAVAHHTTVTALKHYNRIPADSDRIEVGRQLLVEPGPWSIKVRKGARVLELYRGAAGNRELYAVFDVGIGRLDKTPAAAFVISVKLRNPDWYAPDGGVVKYGDPENPLGNYFLKLAATGTPDKPLLGYGIHGTRDETDVTRSLSNGCIRMRDADVGALYIIVPNRTPVEIVE